jgi:hypothetical protein
MNNNRAKPILTWILYGLAVITLVAALWLLFTAIGFNRTSSSALETLLDAFGPVAGLLAEMLNTAVAIIGLVFSGLALTISALLFTAAQLLIYSTNLTKRVTDLESKLSALEKSKTEE